jgi:hypothetical protein
MGLSKVYSRCPFFGVSGIPVAQRVALDFPSIVTFGGPYDVHSRYDDGHERRRRGDRISSRRPLFGRGLLWVQQRLLP